MADKTKINVDFEKGVISDNRGNVIEKGADIGNIAERLPKITCDGQKKEINPEAVTKALAATLTDPKSNDPSEYDWNGPAKENGKSNPNKTDFWRLNDANKEALTAVAGIVNKAIDSTSNIEVTLKDGLASPLTSFCKEGEASGLFKLGK
jgi:hypothetical protein